MTVLVENGSSRALLTRALRYGTNDAIVRTNIVAVTVAYDPSHEVNAESYDSPWRSLALIFSLAGKPDLARVAFDKAISWFEVALGVGAIESTVLRGASLTMRTLCHLQAGHIEEISNESLQEIMECLDKAITSNMAEIDQRYLQMDYARLNFLAQRYGLDNAVTFAKRARAHYKPSSPVHPSIRFLVEELDSLWRMARLTVEVGDGDALRTALVQMLSFGEVFQRASREGAWEIGKDLGVLRVLKTYLAAVDLCAPTLSEASQAVDVVVDFLACQKLQPTQSIHDRAALLLTRSIFSSAISLRDASEVAMFLQEAISKCTVAAKKLGLASDRIFNQISHAFTDFVATDVMRFCSDMTGLDERAAVIRSVCLAAEEAKISLRDDVWKVIAALLLADLEAQTGTTVVMKIATVAERFGSELRTRMDRVCMDDKLPIKHYLEQEALSRCNRFLETVVEDTLSAHNMSNQEVIISLLEAAKVYISAGLEPRMHLWNTAFHCLQRMPSSLALTVLMSWILEDPNLKENLWTRLEAVLESLVEHAKGCPAVLPIGISALMKHNQKAILNLLFGSNPELQEIMLPVVRRVLEAKEQSTAREALLTWVTASRGRSFDYERLARETVASLLLAASDDSAEGVIFVQAARELIARHIATLNTREQPRLAPIVAKLLASQVMGMSRADLEQQLINKGDSGEPARINFLKAANNLSDKDAIALLDIIRQDATSYSYLEFSTARDLAMALLARESVRCHLGENPSEEQRNTVSQLIIRFFPPVTPTGRWSSRSWSGDPKNALSHDEAFTSCRQLVELLLRSSSQTSHHTLTTLTNWNCTIIWGLTRWLADISITAERSNTTAEALHTACRACLDAILTSQYKSMTYHGEGKDHTVWWREKADLPPTVADLILPQILEHPVDVVSSIPPKVDEYHEWRQVLCSAVPVLAATGVLTPLCADLIDRFLDMSSWSEERVFCLAFIKEALQIDLGQDSIARAIEATLRRATSKKLWTTDKDVVSLLCGLSGPTGNRFTELFYRHVTPSHIVSSAKLWEIAEWIAAETIDPGDLSTRLIEVMRIAQTKAGSAPTRRQGLGAWATVVSALCAKIEGYRAKHIPLADILRVVEFANMPLFGQRVEELLLESPEQDSSTRQAISEALNAWEQVAIELLKGVPDKMQLNCVSVEWLLRLREFQAEFRRVHDIVNTIAQTDLVLQNPELVVTCIESCVRQQDLDGVETLLYHGLAMTTKSSPEAAAIFLVNAISSFWHLGEGRLSLLFLRNILGQLRVSPHEISEATLKNICKLANEKLRRDFQNPPELTLAIDNGSGRVGG